MKDVTELNPLLYPTRIWVCTKVPMEELCKRFYALAGNNEVVDLDPTETDSSKIATCTPVNEKKSGWKGILLTIHRPKDFTAGVAAHEAEHIVCWICGQLGIDCTSFEDSEPRAYLMQWLVDEIMKIVKGKK